MSEQKPTSRVWVCESGDYEQRCVWGVYASVEAAAESLKAEHPAPYRVTWHAPEGQGEGSWSIRGDFEQVQHYSTQHTAYYDLTAHDVIDGKGSYPPSPSVTE